MEFNATFIVSAISFIVFTVLMNLILYKPIQEVVDKRKKFIDDNYSDAKSNLDKSSKLLKDRDDKLLKTNRDARALVDVKVNASQSKKDEMASNATIDAKNNIAERKQLLGNNADEARETLKVEVINLAQMISNKFLNTEEKIENVDNDLIDGILQG